MNSWSVSCLGGRWEAAAPTGMGDPAITHVRKPACVNATAAGSRFGWVMMAKHKLSICRILRTPKYSNRSRGSVSIDQALGPG